MGGGNYNILRYGCISKISEPLSDPVLIARDLEILQHLYSATVVVVHDAAGLLIILEGEVKSVNKVSEILMDDPRMTDHETVFIQAATERLYKGWSSCWCNAELRPPLKAELTRLRDNIASGTATSLKNTKVLQYLSAFQLGRQMMQRTGVAVHTDKQSPL